MAKEQKRKSKVVQINSNTDSIIPFLAMKYRKKLERTARNIGIPMHRYHKMKGQNP